MSQSGYEGDQEDGKASEISDSMNDGLTSGEDENVATAQPLIERIDPASLGGGESSDISEDDGDQTIAANFHEHSQNSMGTVPRAALINRPHEVRAPKTMFIHYGNGNQTDIEEVEVIPFVTKLAHEHRELKKQNAKTVATFSELLKYTQGLHNNITVLRDVLFKAGVPFPEEVEEYLASHEVESIGGDADETGTMSTDLMTFSEDLMTFSDINEATETSQGTTISKS
ncbi:hypothetical protein PMZ80_002905 [Knufia obscura]|uniref:Uncharacterized protein n=2 Tax=Knufia TaxID=430999 RepID=A0AAN8I705_9EURO|nr:hypothetical protein PMZ80_002905 [Knufia obscura]KAK5952506.1 hypothetical protein OHC33_006550 [Knufia fluminis]